jgi:HD-GYP domain-containing protein (c-di-GMP phosphodiesterase class II)
LGETTVRTYIAGLAALSIALAASWIYWYSAPTDPRFVLGVAVFAGLLCLLSLYRIRVSERCEISALDIGLVASIVMLGPFWGAVAALPCAVVVGKKDWLRTAYEATRNTIQIYLAGMVFFTASGPLLTRDPESTSLAVYATFASAVALLIAGYVIDAGLLKAKYGQGFGVTWSEQVEPYLLSDSASVLTSGLGVLALLKAGPVTALIVLAGSIGSQMLVYSSREQVKENDELRTRVGSLEEALATSNMTFGAMMIQELGRKDGYTHRHAAATAVYAADLAREMKLGDTRAEQLRMAGLLHNIGLFGLPEELLRATGKLNSIAQSQLADHPARGEEALAAIPEFEEMASWVRWHHERPDGRGYPDKLRGAWIPLEAKILAVAQAYAAMVLDQPHRPGIGFAEAREKLSAGIDTEFDGVVVRSLMRILDTESEGYRMADDYRFVFPTPKDRERARPAVPEGLARDLPG